MASTAATGRAHQSHRKSDAPCALCVASAAPPAIAARDTRFAPLADAPLPWLLTVGIAAPLALIFENAERWFAVGVTTGVLVGAAFAWRLQLQDRAIGHAATKRVRSELTAEGDARAETVIRQFEWAVNDVAGLREKLEQAQQEQATSAARARPTAGRNSSNASCFVIASRPGRRRMPWPTLPYRIPHRPPAPVELRWALHDDGPLAWLDLGADDPDALPARVRVLERDGNVIAVSDPAVHGASRDGIGRTASLVLPAPAQLADALRSGALADYRFEALIAHRWVGVRLTPRADRPEHRQARPRLAPELGLQRVHGDVAHHQQQHHDRDDDPDPLEIPHHERPLRRGGTLEHCRWLADSA